MTAAKTTAWPATGPKARLYFALRTAGAAGLTTNVLQALVGGGLKNVEAALYGLAREGWISQGSAASPWRLLNTQDLPPIEGLEFALDTTLPLVERLLRLVRANMGGIDTEALGLHCGCTEAEAFATLEASPERKGLVACRLLRGGKPSTLYRVGTGGVRTLNWAAQGAASMRARVDGEAFGSQVAP